jgi:hypothetical protein
MTQLTTSKRQEFVVDARRHIQFRARVSGCIWTKSSFFDGSGCFHDLLSAGLGIGRRCVLKLFQDCACPKTKHVSRISAVDAEKFGLLRFPRITYRFARREGPIMRAHWDRTLVIATLAIAIIVCLWGIKILLVV